MKLNNFKCILLASLIWVTIAQPVTYTYKGAKIDVIINDITKQKSDVIVNAANKKLLAGSGVCGAIFKAAGKERLQKACNTFHADKQGIRCHTGQAKITPSFNLANKGIKNVIHAVGPDCRVVKDSKTRYTLLRSAYTQSLKLADRKKLKSISFPFISSAVFACPKDFAAKVAGQAIKHYLANHPKTRMKKISLVLFDKKDYAIVKKAFSKIF
jgi:O-acetyl-ADP-ribose deacetylase